VSWTKCEVCKEGGLVKVEPLYRGKKGWGAFVGALCPHTRANMPLIKGKVHASSMSVTGYTSSQNKS